MRRRYTVSTPAVIAALVAGWAAAPALAEQKPYASARDCLRSVAKVETGIEAQEDEASAETTRLIAQARDLCMQTRYDRVEKLLGEIRKTVAGTE